MTKTLKWLGGGLAAAMLLAAVGLFSGNAVEAQDPPPTQPSLFGGTVTVDGDGAAAGTVVTAVADGENCAAGTVTTGEGGSRYSLLVPSTCNSEVSTVSFTVGGVDTGQTADRGSPTPTTVDLTVTSAVEEEADVPAPPAGDEEDADMPAPPADDEEEADVPAPPADDEEEADVPAPPADDEEEADVPAPPADDEDADGMGDDEDADGMGDDEDADGMGDDEDADGMGDDEDADGMGDDEDADGMGDDEDADGMGDEEDADGMGDEEDADGMGDEEDMAPDVMDTGTGLAPNTSASLAAILGLTALAVVLGGYTFARRRS